MSTLFDLLRALLYSAGFVLLWGYLAIQVRPLDQRLGGALPTWTPAAGIGLMVVGGLIAAMCIGGFVIWGHGTPAPFDAPRRFVAQGPYRFVRNPMYIGGWAVLAGYGLVQRSPAILWLSLVMIGCAHLFVVLYEEPNLERRFGEDYRAYKRAVRRWLPRFAAMALLWLSVGACGGGPVPSAGPGVTTRVTEYRNGRWFDGQRFVPRTMFVSGDRFRDRRPRHVDTVIDLAGHWVVPPYADAQQPMIEPAHIAIYTRLFLHDGIFYVRDQGGAPTVRAQIDTAVNTATSFDVVSANQGWTAPGGYPLKDRLDSDALMLVATADDVARCWPLFMSARPKPDYVKLYLLYSEQYARRQDDAPAAFDRGLDPALVPDIVHRAHAAGLPVSAHVYTAADFRNAVSGGVDEIVHVPGGGDLPAEAFRLTDLDAEVAAGRRVAVVTALGKLAEQMRRDSAATVERIRDVYAPNVETLRRRGVRLLVGGDLFRQSAAAEIRVLGRLGMFSSLELLRMWSVITPQALFPRRKIGELADGYEASFLVLAGDPLQDFTNAQRIERRVKRGRSLVVPAEGPTFP
jgi:protein-S-isoprenylcysteine O-methyltransferase Ste14